jgi:hypothetical protein
MLVEHENPTELAKEIFWLAWQACGGPMGMGFLQDRSGVTRDDVWGNVNNAGDYPMNHNKANEPYADYVFGRMMKVGVTILKDGIEMRDFEPRADYQSWCRTYRTVEDLVNKAVENVSYPNN